MHDDYIRLAKKAAYDAGNFLLKRKNIHIDANYDHDIKLSSDKESEKIIIDVLKPSGLPILSEECGLIGDTTGLHWIIDPIDGTVNYYKGLDELCCISIALYDGDSPVFGVINRFAVNELYIGEVNEYAQCNGKPIKPSGVKKLCEAVIATGFPSGMDYSDDNIKQLIQCIQRAKKVRMLGTAAIMAAFVACGRIDAYYEQDINIWDIAAAAAITKAAGGVVRLIRNPESYKCDFGAFATIELMKEFYGS